MSAAYAVLPTTNGHPPQRTKDLLARLTNTAPPTRIRRLLIFVAVVVLSASLLVYLYSPSFSFPGSGFKSILPGGGYYNDYKQEGLGGNSLGGVGPDGPNSPFFRDAHPALHARLFLARAQAEIRARGLDTCGGQLSARMVEGYVEGAVPYCAAPSLAGPAVTCFPAGGAAAPSSPNKWWPYPQAFCTSEGLAHTPGWGGDVPVRGLFTGRCAVTNWGADLKSAMGREVFLGSEFAEDTTEPSSCAETLTHPVLFVHRQDRWNPFHVGEDLVTTFLALTIFSRQPSASSSVPSAAEQHLWAALPASYAHAEVNTGTAKVNTANTRKETEFTRLAASLAAQLTHTEGLQLVFQDDHLPTESLFAPLYDRIGAFAPRWTGAEGLDTTCLTHTFHSVGAGASVPVTTNANTNGQQAQGQVGEPVQVLFLSREKFDAYTKHTKHKLTPWQDARHISNEGALVAGLRAGLAGLCRVVTGGGGAGMKEGEATHAPGTNDCAYTDADALPGAWGVRMHAQEAHVLGVSSGAGSGSGSGGRGGASGSGKDSGGSGSGGDTVAGGSGSGSESESGGGSAHTGVPPGEGTANERRWDSTYISANSSHAARAAPFINAPAPARPAPRALRFATLDPTTSALPAQLGAVGRADVVISVHAGALGLTLFMPTGRASVVELMTTGAMGNWHFHNMAHMMGMEYLRIDVQKNVDVPKVVQAVRELVERRLQKP
ncbi:hypothetical protein B0H12DRAFT_724337 [Mycena haematopus]|nr:hypothetical protein B0H12DRAFT_724337 [Mycena haematopus]